MFKDGCLPILHNVSPDGNFFNPDRIQVCETVRTVERDAEQRMAYGLLIATPPAHTNVYNGQLVDMATMLMCSKCCVWKLDEKFRQDARNTRSRRGKSYWCKGCLSTSPMYTRPDEDETPQIRERRKKRR